MNSFPPMRSGGHTLAAVPEMDGPAVESTMIRVVKEMYTLAAKHTRCSGRTVVSKEDIVRALEVVVLPSYGLIETLQVPTHTIHTVPGETSDEDMALNMMALEFAGRVLAKGTRINAKGQLQLEEKPDYELDEEEFTVAPNDVQLEDNSMYLMENADRAFEEYLESTPIERMEPLRRALVKGVLRMIAVLEMSEEMELEAEEEEVEGREEEERGGEAEEEEEVEGREDEERGGEGEE